MQEHNFETMRHCVYAYLRHVRGAIGEISAIEEQMAKQQASLALMGMSYDVGHGSAYADKIPDGVAKAFELRDKWSEAYARLADGIELARTICSDEYPGRRILWMKVVDGMSWRQISSKMHYSTKHLQRKADNGIVSVYYAMPEEWRRDPIPNAAPM